MKRFIGIFLILQFCIGPFINTPAIAEEKDHMKAFFLSFLVPGAGQYYAGSPGFAKLFLAAELAIWGGYYYNLSMKDSSRQDYLTQASLHAGTDLSGASSSYINAVGTYNSSYDYNHRRLQMEFNPTVYYGDDAWEWDDPAELSYFKNLRERELDYENYAKFCIAGVILNHFLAGLNASNIVRSHNQNTALTVNVLHGGGLGATYMRRF